MADAADRHDGHPAENREAHIVDHLSRVLLEDGERPHPPGRLAEKHGYPIKIADLIAQVDGAAYVARGAMHTPAAIAWTKRILTEAFQAQLERKGFSFVEILTMCPTDWYVEPSETPDWIEQNFTGTYPLKILKAPA